MWCYKLVTNSGDTFYYDSDELEQARIDRLTYGGTITDKNGKTY